MSMSRTLRFGVLLAMSLFRGHVLAQDSAAQPTVVDPAVAAYVEQITKAINRRLIYPPDVEGKSCRVFVTQDDTGEVQDVKFSNCATATLAKHVQAAVLKASPLPLPANSAVFNRNLTITFVVPAKLPGSAE